MRGLADEDRFGGLTACDTRRRTYGTGRRTILTYSAELHAAQARELDGTTLAKAGKKLDELAATLVCGKARRSRDKVEAEIGSITRKPWVRRVVTWQLSGSHPGGPAAGLGIDQAARAALEEELFGKHVLISDHDDWSAAEAIAGYRSQSEAEVSFRQLKDPARRVILPDVPLDRAQHPRAHLHLRARPASRPPHAAQGPPGRPGPIRTRDARRTRPDQRGRPAPPG